MMLRCAVPLALAVAFTASAAAQSVTADPAPLVLGETFVIASAVLDEARRINVYRPTVYGTPVDGPLPVLYMPDGGADEDFIHVAGLLQVSVSNGTMRPFLLVGIENTARRRDLTGPTSDPEDLKVAPAAGGSAAFRRFIRSELMPVIDARHATTGETAIVGESLAGLFIIETLFREPDLFDTYIAFDPSLWWNDAELLAAAAKHADVLAGRALYLANSSQPEIAALTQRLAAVLDMHAPADARWHHQPMPEETHATIYHPAALRAFRQMFAPEAPQR